MSIDPVSLPRRYQDQVAAQLYKHGSPTAPQKPTAKARLRQKAGDGLTLWLPNYLTPSLNHMLGRNHWLLTKMKKEARIALQCALLGTDQNS